MSLLTVNNLAKAYPPTDIFSGVSFNVPNKARMGIVGANGIGKTTLLRVIAGEESASEGEVIKAKGLTIGYLPQVAKFESKKTLWDECMQGFAPLLKQEAQLKKLEKQLVANPNDEALINQYGALQQDYENKGGYTYLFRIKQALEGLSFKEEEYQMPLSKLSGGQRTRAFLVKLLLSNPDLLILDEPTNHLDIQAVEWLEKYLRDWEGAVLIVSHDRYFLDKVATVILEMRFGGIEQYRGNYSAYLLHREQRTEDRIRFAETERARMLKEIDYIRRNMAGQRTQMAQGKLSRLSREIFAVEKFGFEGVRGKKWSDLTKDGRNIRHPMGVEEAYRRIAALRSPSESKELNMKLKIRAKERSGNIIIRANDLTIGYPNNPLFEIEKLTLHRLECAALIGPNGSGKTTFLRTILGQIEPLVGQVNLGASLKIGYFAQAHENLKAEHTLIQEIESIKPGMLEKEIRSYLGRYLFRGETHYQQVSTLSGGERGRLALAKLSLTDANLLLLDEPSNHLDIASQEILQTVLADFNGTIILVSHDRYLIDALATQIWFIDDREQSLEIFKGNYTEYRQKDTVVNEVPQSTPKKEATPPSTSSTEPKVQENQQKKPLSKFERKRIEDRIVQVEELIIEIELKLNKIEKQMQSSQSTPEDIQSLGEEYAYVQKDLEDTMQEWEELHLKQAQ